MVGSSKLKGLSVLVVDDELILLKVVESTLKKQPYQVITTESVEEALAILNEREVAVVISDYKMPRIKGVEFLEKVRKEHPSVIRIMMTAYADLSVSIEAINRVGVFRFILKPWEQIEFLNTIESALEFYLVRSEKAEIERQLQEHTQQLHTDTEEQSAEKTRIIQELRERNQELARINQQLRQSDKLASLGSMAELLAADISTPLSEVLEKLEVLYSRSNLTDLDRELILEMKPQIQRIKSLAKSIYNYAQKSNKTHEKVDLVESIRNALGLAQEVVDFKNIEIVEQYPVEKTLISGMKNQIEQVFIILIQNALQSMENSGTLICGITGQPGGNGKDAAQWHVSIASDGHPLSTDMFASLADPEDRDKTKFTNFGLNICQQIIEEHNGQVEVGNNSENGSFLRIKLPLESEQ